MNANELADKLNLFWHTENDKLFEDAATMLRAQADLIDCLRMGQPNIDYDKELLKPIFVGRELTDEEIMKLYDQDDLYNIDEGQMYLKPIEFARAILRKVQEADKIESLGTVNIGGVHFRNGKEVK